MAVGEMVGVSVGPGVGVSVGVSVGVAVSVAGGTAVAVAEGVDANMAAARASEVRKTAVSDMVGGCPPANRCCTGSRKIKVMIKKIKARSIKLPKIRSEVLFPFFCLGMA
ncbi:MAG: hypothetical protein CSB13_11810 [Chloroflexi bacterium]|nr:MAG: hypothetical protein CSB13_11810 [Chloroflexota bacterium]